MNIKRLMDLGCYRGLRHRRGLPVQRPAHPEPTPAPARGRANPSASSRRRRRPSRPAARQARTEQNRNRTSMAEPTPTRRNASAPSYRRRGTHVHASFNNTIITISGPAGQRACAGPPPAVPATGARARAPRSRPRSPPRSACNMTPSSSTACKQRGRVREGPRPRGASPRCGR